jgi:hypothetical protein
MRNFIIFDGKRYSVCGSQKISLNNKLSNEKTKNKIDINYHLYQNDTILDNNLSIPFINNIENDIFQYEIINDYYMITKMKECIELDKNNGLNSNIYYLRFIKSLPWTKELDAVIDTYNNCSQILENHFRKKHDRQNITFCSVPIKYNRFYYEYVLWTSEACTECEKNEENGCPIYNKLNNFINKKFNNLKK